MPPRATAHIGAFEAGQIKVHMEHDLTAAEIARRVMKPDGESSWSETAISAAMDKPTAAGWRGERSEGSGRRRKTTKAFGRNIFNEVLRKRGKVRVNAGCPKRKHPEARHLSDTLLEERLYETGLVYLRRRRKTIILGQVHRDARMAWARSVLRMHDATFKRWAYADGAVFYLDRTKEENASSQRAALGGFVWRRADWSDALYDDCVGPSLYTKAQGTPVRIWGALAEGFLRIYIMPEGEVMNMWWFAWLIEKRSLSGWATATVS
jgi:hypothetical protein